MSKYAEMSENDMVTVIIDLCFKIHKTLGPGLLESVYEEILFYELKKFGFDVTRQKAVPVYWDSLKMDIGFRYDLLVENKVMIELKATQGVTPVFKKTLLTYIRLCNIKLGLLINFNEELLKDGITRVVNKL